MYASPKVVPVVLPVVAGAVTTLPNTGGNLVVSVALAVGAGMLTWGVLYARGR